MEKDHCKCLKPDKIRSINKPTYRCEVQNVTIKEPKLTNLCTNTYKSCDWHKQCEKLKELQIEKRFKEKGKSR